MTWDEVKELGPLYAIGALDQETAQTIEEFLRYATLEQKSEFSEWQEVVACLPMALPQPKTSPHLKANLLARIAANEENMVAAQPETTAKVLNFQPKPRVERQRSQWLLLAASFALACISVFQSWQNSKLTVRLNESDVQISSLKLKFEDFISANTRIISMAGVETPQANAKVVWNTQTQAWKIYINNLPAPPGDMDYQLWYVTKDAKINAAVFRTNETGTYELVLPPMPAEAVKGLAATAVTLEPKGGSAQPTGKFYLLASI